MSHIWALGSERVKCVSSRATSLHDADFFPSFPGKTALSMAADKGQELVVKLLVERGANQHAANKKGMLLI